ncbi:MAG: hypothetical protein WAX66_03505 [Patescibacteria group bacterium]
MKKLTLPKITLSKKQLLLICIPISIIILLVTGFFILKGMGKINWIEKTEDNQTTKGFADDSEAALQALTQPYDLEDSTPTFDLYGEVGYDNETIPVVVLRSDYSVDAEPCSYNTLLSDEDNTECLILGREKLVIPNHATTQIHTNSYKEEYETGKTITYSAYALLPDESMVSMTNNSKLQFNFYDNETRIVQMKGQAYYRVNKQPEGHKFTIQAGDRIIELSDAEITLSIYEDGLANYQDKKNVEESNLVGNNLKADIYIIYGSANIYTRGSSNSNTIALSGDNYSHIIKFKDTGTRKSTDESSEEIIYQRELFTKYSAYFTNQIMFSVNSYGLGNFNSQNTQDKSNMLAVRFNSVETFAYNYVQAYTEDMDNFKKEWNDYINKASTCQEGWYKIENVGCCPDGYVYNSTRKTCTKTTTYYYCEDGWTLKNGMCYKNGSSSTIGQTPGSNSTDSLCVDKSTPIAYGLCKVGVDSGSGYLSGSKCCLGNSIPTPTLEQ